MTQTSTSYFNFSTARFWFFPSEYIVIVAGTIAMSDVSYHRLLLGSDDAEETEQLVQVATVAALVFMNSLNERNAKVTGPPFVWGSYLQGVLCYPGRFERRYRMSLEAFDKLCAMLAPLMHRSHGNSTICVPVVLHCTLRWLAGGSYDDICATVSTTVSSFYRYVSFGMSSIVLCKSLAITFPSTDDELVQQCQEFESLSSHGALKGCVGAIDGWLCRIKAPSRNETSHVVSYFSGHYHASGINVQAACDHLSRFTAFSMRFPGGTNDARAYKHWSFRSTIEMLPLGMYLIGDNAYVVSEQLLTP